MENKDKLAFNRKNYLMMLIGVLIIAAGFTIMSLETAPNGFGPMALTIGPLIVMAGFIFEFFAIFHKPKNRE